MLQANLKKNSDHAINALGPQIPFIADKAFFPIRPDLKGVNYPYRVCTGTIIMGHCAFGDWRIEEANLMFLDLEMMAWLKAKDFGMCKRPLP